MNSKITKLRSEINEIDTQIIDLLARRFHLTREIGKLKTEEGAKIQDTDREAELEAMYYDLSMQKGLDPEAIHRIFHKIFEESREDQISAPA